MTRNHPPQKNLKKCQRGSRAPPPPPPPRNVLKLGTRGVHDISKNYLS